MARADEVQSRTSRILELRDAYYEGDTVLASDEEYDKLMRRLEELERRFPELQGQDSPTQTVGSRAETTLFAPVNHPERMLSLDNVFSLDEFRAWALKVERDSGRKPDWLCELKIDGLAINLRYENGRLTSAATRGDGVVGEDVTQNIRCINDIPERLAERGHPPLVEVRGEIFFPVEAFRELNRLQAEAGERIFANPRNAASGSLRQKEEGKNAAAKQLMHNRLSRLADARARHRRLAEPPVATPERDLRAPAVVGPAHVIPLQGLRRDRRRRRSSSSTSASTGTASSTRSTASS